MRKGVCKELHTFSIHGLLYDLTIIIPGLLRFCIFGVISQNNVFFFVVYKNLVGKRVERTIQSVVSDEIGRVVKTNESCTGNSTASYILNVEFVSGKMYLGSIALLKCRLRNKPSCNETCTGN